jgi:Zinc carboxypeptidase
MRRWPSVLIVVAATLASVAPAAAAPPRERDRLDAYTAAATPGQLRILRELGYEVTPQRVGGRLQAGVVLSRVQRAALTRRGVRTRLVRLRGGQTVRQYAAAQAQDGFTVWRSWDEPGGIRDQMRAVAAENPRIAKLVTLGTSTQGREILAVKLTRRARTRPDGSRPAVLHVSTQHAREWIGTEVNRRLLMSYVNRWRDRDPDVRELLRETELWFVLVANPDGYQYTFDSERLWRKTLRDNNGDGQIAPGDGVDPNRNFPNHWGYDEEGSSSQPTSETYRGPAPASEPETQALKALMDRIGFTFFVNWHSNGQWLLYGEGWRAPRRPMTRSTSRCRATSTGRPSPSSTRASAPTCCT